MPALLGCAAVYKDSGLLAEALAALDKALALLEPAEPGEGAKPADAAAPGDEASGTGHHSSSGGSSGGGAAAAAATTAAAAAVQVPGLPCSPADVRQALAVVQTDLGTQLKLAGQAGWRQRYEAAVAACPSYAPAHYNLGALTRLHGPCMAAVRWGCPASMCRSGPAVLPTLLHPCMLHAGVASGEEGGVDEAIAHYSTAVRLARCC